MKLESIFRGTMWLLLGCVLFAPACGSDNTSKGTGNLSGKACKGGEILAKAFDLSAGCIHTTNPVTVGCADPALPGGAQSGKFCWRAKSSGRVVLATVPLANLHENNSPWTTCDAASQATLVAAHSCDVSKTCGSHQNTTCSLADTCKALHCGSKSSPYRADGCKRTHGAACSTDQDCGGGMLCAFPDDLFGISCAYEPDGTCACAGADNGWAGPQGTCVERR